MAPLRNLLCAVDFSDTSIEALRYATATARRTGGVIHVLHAWLPPVIPLAEGGVVLRVEVSKRITADLERGVRDLVAKHCEPAIPVETHVVMADVAPCIVGRARTWGCDTIVIGTHGRSGLPRALLGSVAERVLRMSSLPVLVVPRRPEGQPSFADRPVRSIVCPLDFSIPAEEGLRVAVELAEAWHIPITALHCHTLSPAEKRDQAFGRSHQELLRLELEDAVRRFAARPVSIAARMVQGETCTGIGLAVERVGADLVVIGTTGRRGVERVLLGSMAERVIRTSSVPVLAVHATPRARPVERGRSAIHRSLDAR